MKTVLFSLFLAIHLPVAVCQKLHSEADYIKYMQGIWESKYMAGNYLVFTGDNVLNYQQNQLDDSCKYHLRYDSATQGCLVNIESHGPNFHIEIKEKTNKKISWGDIEEGVVVQYIKRKDGTVPR